MLASYPVWRDSTRPVASQVTATGTLGRSSYARVVSGRWVGLSVM